MAANCSNVALITPTECPVFKKDFHAQYVGMLKCIEYKNGILNALFGHFHISVKIESLPEWLKDGCYVQIDITESGCNIEPFDYDPELGRIA